MVQVTEKRPRRRTRRVPQAEKQPEGDQPAKADVSERASDAVVDSKAPGKKFEAGELPRASTPPVLAPVTLRQQNLRPPMLARPPALPPKPKLRQVSAQLPASSYEPACLCHAVDGFVNEVGSHVLTSSVCSCAAPLRVPLGLAPPPNDACSSRGFAARSGSPAGGCCAGAKLAHATPASTVRAISGRSWAAGSRP